MCSHLGTYEFEFAWWLFVICKRYEQFSLLRSKRCEFFFRLKNFQNLIYSNWFKDEVAFSFGIFVHLPKKKMKNKNYKYEFVWKECVRSFVFQLSRWIQMGYIWITSVTDLIFFFSFYSYDNDFWSFSQQSSFCLQWISIFDVSGWWFLSQSLSRCSVSFLKTKKKNTRMFTFMII